MATTRKSFLIAAALAVATTITLTAATVTGTTMDTAWFVAGATMVSLGLYAIEPVRERVRRAARRLLDDFMATARHQLHIRHKLIAQAHDAVARRAAAHRQDAPTLAAQWRMCPSV